MSLLQPVKCIQLEPGRCKPFQSGPVLLASGHEVNINDNRVLKLGKLIKIDAEEGLYPLLQNRGCTQFCGRRVISIAAEYWL
jgi:hypothetical protein